MERRVSQYGTLVPLEVYRNTEAQNEGNSHGTMLIHPAALSPILDQEERPTLADYGASFLGSFSHSSPPPLSPSRSSTASLSDTFPNFQTIFQDDFASFLGATRTTGPGFLSPPSASYEFVDETQRTVQVHRDENPMGARQRSPSTHQYLEGRVSVQSQGRQQIRTLLNQNGGATTRSVDPMSPSFLRQLQRLSASTRARPPRFAAPSKSKTVFTLQCAFCANSVCLRAMKAILLADTKVELFSTDTPSGRQIRLLEDDYTTFSCHCHLRDVACGDW